MTGARRPPTTGLEHRTYKGTDHAVMLREIADFIDERNPGRLVMSMWSGVSDDFESLFLEVIIDHDEDAYVYDDRDEDDDDWFLVAINRDWAVGVQARSSSDAMTAGCDAWRAEFTDGEDRGEIDEVLVRRLDGPPS